MELGSPAAKPLCLDFYMSSGIIEESCCLSMVIVTNPTGRKCLESDGYTVIYVGL